MKEKLTLILDKDSYLNIADYSPRSWSNLGKLLIFDKKFPADNTTNMTRNMIIDQLFLKQGKAIYYFHHYKNDIYRLEKTMKKKLLELDYYIKFVVNEHADTDLEPKFSLLENTTDMEIKHLVGFYIAERFEIELTYDVKGVITPLRDEEISKDIQQEISDYNDWIIGNIYKTYLVDESGNIIDEAADLFLNKEKLLNNSCDDLLTELFAIGIEFDPYRQELAQFVNNVTNKTYDFTA